MSGQSTGPKHASASPLAGQVVRIVEGRLAGTDLLVEDWWDRIAGKSWMDCNGNPTCLEYAISDFSAPLDDEVVYGKVGVMGALVHVSFLATAVRT